MKAIPLGWREAVAFVNGTHRHHKSPQGWRFGIGAVKSGELVLWQCRVCGRKFQKASHRKWLGG